MPEAYHCIGCLYQNVMVIVPFAKTSPMILFLPGKTPVFQLKPEKDYLSQIILENDISLKKKTGKAFVEFGGYPAF